MKDQVFVELFHETTGKVEKCMGPMPLAKAEKVAAGAYRNMHEDYSVRIVDDKTVTRT